MAKTLRRSLVVGVIVAVMFVAAGHLAAAIVAGMFAMLTFAIIEQGVKDETSRSDKG